MVGCTPLHRLIIIIIIIIFFFGFAKFQAPGYTFSRSEVVCSTYRCVWSVCVCTKKRKQRRKLPQAQWTWAPALECRLASMMEKASCSSLISFSLFSSRKDTRESRMSTTSIIC